MIYNCGVCNIQHSMNCFYCSLLDKALLIKTKCLLHISTVLRFLHTHVLRQIGSVVEAKVAMLAVELSVVLVHVLVLQEGGAMCEALPAILLRAGVWLLPAVCALMLSQRGLPFEGAPARGTGVRVFRRVNALVLVEAVRPLESLATRAAAEWTGTHVHRLVLRDVPLPFKELATCRTGARALVGVNQSVLDQVP